MAQELIKRDLKPPYDWDEYATLHFPQAEKLWNIAKSAEAKGELDKASEYYIRASAVYRLARFPAPRSDKQWEAWRLGKESCLKGLSLRPHPVKEILVQHTHRLPHEGDVIPVYYLLPEEANQQNPVPCVIIICGLDAYRTEGVILAEGFRQVGVATIVAEVPGTGDCPAAPAENTSPDRLYTSLLDWIQQQNGIDSNRIGVWACSTGGYYAIRLAHTHANRLAGVVAQGGGCHHMFDPEWLDFANQMEYPFDLAGTLAHKFNYGNDLEAFKREASSKYSLLNDGTLDKECTRLLLINGTDDEVFPIDDYYLLLQHGTSKEAWFEPGAKHMGGIPSYRMSIHWLLKLFKIEADPEVVIRSMLSKPRY